MNRFALDRHARQERMDFPLPFDSLHFVHAIRLTLILSEMHETDSF